MPFIRLWMEIRLKSGMKYQYQYYKQILPKLMKCHQLKFTVQSGLFALHISSCTVAHWKFSIRKWLVWFERRAVVKRARIWLQFRFYRRCLANQRKIAVNWCCEMTPLSTEFELQMAFPNRCHCRYSLRKLQFLHICVTFKSGFLQQRHSFSIENGKIHKKWSFFSRAFLCLWILFVLQNWLDAHLNG